MDKLEKAIALKIGIIGAESTGKTWLCERLATHFNGVYVPEYAREYFNDSDIYNYTLGDLEKIAVKQLFLERASLEKGKPFVFCDTNLITLKIWAELEYGSVPEIIKNNLDSFGYDHLLVTNNDQDWIEDPLRLNKYSRDLIFEMNIKEAEKLKVKYTVISGKEDDRLKSAIEAINRIAHSL